MPGIQLTEQLDGYRYESTAIYGLVSMIASNAGDSDLANRAMARMESMRIFDFDSKLNGALEIPTEPGFIPLTSALDCFRIVLPIKINNKYGYNTEQ